MKMLKGEHIRKITVGVQAEAPNLALPDPAPQTPNPRLHCTEMIL
jgi:hypothetical protein